MSRVALTTIAFASITSAAHAERPDEQCGRPSTASVELAPWAAVGGGIRAANGEVLKGIGDLSLHAAATIPVSRLARAGAWIAPGTTDFASFDGARVELHSNDADDDYVKLFGVDGRWTVLADVGAGHRFGHEGNRGAFFVARMALGFTARNRLYHLYGSTPCHCDSDPNVADERLCRPTLGLVSGARPYVTFQHALDGSRTEVTAGIEFELIGAGWWVGAAF